MEEVYVVKVKTRPEPSKLYPSERRYSAVTVGGLGLVHALLAVTSLLLAALGIAAEGVAASYGAGIALGLAGSGAAVVGVLAWRRWYVDNNIRYFLVTSMISGLAAIVCIVLTSVAIATMQEDLALHRLSLRYNAEQLPVRLPLVAPEPGYQDAAYDDVDDDDDNNHNNTELIQKFILAFENRKNRSDLQSLPSNETFRLKLDDFDRAIPEDDEKTRTVPSVMPIQTDDDDVKVFEHRRKETEETEETDRDDVIDGDYRTIPSTATVGTEDVSPILLKNNGRIVHEDAGKEVRNVLSINILIASFLELAWSLLSMRIAWKGMTNDYPDDDAIMGSEKTKQKTETGYLPKFMMKSDRTKEREGGGAAGVRRPDILSNHQSQRHNVRRKMTVAVVSDDVEQYLPQQESTTEYHERVRRFLASNNENAC